MSAPTVTAREIAAIEDVLGMGGGYVLGFSNRTFRNFFADFEVDIENQGYLDEGTSKACRMRSFLRHGYPTQVATVLEALLEERGLREGDHASKEVARYREAIRRLRRVPGVHPASATKTEVLSLTYVAELDKKTDQRLAAEDWDGAITVARTTLEAVLEEIERHVATAPCEHRGDLAKLFKSVAKGLRIDDQRADLDDNFKQVVRGLVQIVNGLAPIRNNMSDGHARKRKPAPHHARVIVNAANTVATFLVESFLAQRERGLLPAVTPHP
ncbi:MAG TPA: abortive infection family protein [Polyangiaceae bacterium]|jgi:hypothetical protein